MFLLTNAFELGYSGGDPAGVALFTCSFLETEWAWSWEEQHYPAMPENSSRHGPMLGTRVWRGARMEYQ